MKYMQKLPLLCTREPHAVSDNEEDSKRFDPLHDKMEYLLDKGKAKYTKNHLKGKKIHIRFNVNSPISGNDIWNSLDIEEYIEDRLADHTYT